MQVGEFPSDELLTSLGYSLAYKGIKDSINEGDIQRLEKCLEDNMEAFVSTGIYLAVEKLRNLTLRNLFKSVAA